MGLHLRGLDLYPNIGPGTSQRGTLSETNRLHLKNRAWKTSFGIVQLGFWCFENLEISGSVMIFLWGGFFESGILSAF